MNASMNLVVKMQFAQTPLVASSAHVNLILREIHTKAVLTSMNVQH